MTKNLSDMLLLLDLTVLTAGLIKTISVLNQIAILAEKYLDLKVKLGELNKLKKSTP